MTACNMKTTHAWRSDGTEEIFTYGLPGCVDGRGSTIYDKVTGAIVGHEVKPHTDGMSHVAGFVEDNLTWRWTDGSFTRNGKIVDDPRKDTMKMDTENITLTLPKLEDSYKRVKVGGLEFDRQGTTNRFKRVGGASTYSWTELFTMSAENTVTVIPNNDAVNVVRDKLTAAGVYDAERHAKAVVSALVDSPKVEIANVADKPAEKPLMLRLLGKKFNSDQVKFSVTDKEAKAILQVLDTDGDVWTMAEDGKYMLTREKARYGDRTFKELSTYAPLTVLSVGPDEG